MAVTIPVNNDILTWAIARAGYELPEFAEKYPRISDWLSGAKQPTVKQLEDFSSKGASSGCRVSGTKSVVAGALNQPRRYP